MTITLPPMLGRSRELVEPALRDAVGRLDPASAQVAAYHFGWQDLDGQPTTAGGKAVRPALALLSAQAAGAATELGLPGAVAVELVHNFSLLHDDVMDHDLHRRHRPTVWSVWGISTAILVGDAMLTLAVQTLADVGGQPAADAQARLAATTQELIRGQVEDLAFEQASRVTVADCLAMARRKTGVLLGCSAAIGAVLAGAPANVVDGLTTYGEQLGLAFQLVDDLLGIWGDPDVTGKPAGSDLRARKKSLPVAYALSTGTAAADDLAAWLERPRPDTDADLALAAGLVEAAGGRDWAAAEAQRRLTLALAALDAAPVSAEANAELRSLADFVVSREV
ncbi:MAG TPA: polyprenyl synthetase family protein [Mycobacteriales bacterium]|nr:polyprenyl synthetase family protein [Mycobacteriales bacterium]